MFLTTDTTAALARARNDGLDLATTKAGDPQPSPSGDKVGGLIESLAAVVPTGITAFYTLFATVARTEMLERGAEERSAYQAAQAQLDPPTPLAEVTAELEAMPLESKDLIELRWAFLALALIVAFALALQSVRKGNARAASKRKGWRLSLEPITAVVALTGWALAAPGTPLGAYLSAGDLAFATVTIATAAGLLLLGFGTKLAEPANTG